MPTRLLAPVLLVAVALAGCSSPGPERASAAAAPRPVRFAEVQRFVAGQMAVRMSVVVRGGGPLDATVVRPDMARVVEHVDDHLVETVVGAGMVHRREGDDEAALSTHNWHQVPGTTDVLVRHSALAALGGPVAVWPLVAGLRDVARTGPHGFRATSADGQAVRLQVAKGGEPVDLAIGDSHLTFRDWGLDYAIQVPGRDIDLTPLADEPGLADFTLGPLQVPVLPDTWEMVRSEIWVDDEEEPSCDSATATYTPNGDDPMLAESELMVSLVEPGCEADDYDYDIGQARTARWGGREVRVLDEVPDFGMYTEEGGIAVWVPTEHGTVVLSTFASEETMALLVASLHPLVPMPLGAAAS